MEKNIENEQQQSEARELYLKCQKKNKFLYGTMQATCICGIKGHACYLNAKSQIEKLKEPVQALMELRDILLEAIKEDLMGKDKLWAEFLHEDCAPGITKLLAREKSQDLQYLSIIADIQKAFVSIYLIQLKNQRYNAEFTSAMTWIFNPDCQLHKLHYKISEDELKKIKTLHQAWRREIKEGDKLDICIRYDERSSLQGWAQASVKNVRGDDLEVEFDLINPDYDNTISRWSTFIAQFETKTKEDYEWRKQNLVDCKQYFNVDCHDKQHWFGSSILKTRYETQAGRQVLMAYIGFRVYTDKIPPGKQEKKDALGTFVGWSEKFDEWIPMFSPRIQPFKSREGVQNADEHDLEDIDDDLFKPEEGFQRVYAVPRKFHCQSVQFMHLINYFGDQNGFQMVLDVLEKAEMNEQLNIQVMGGIATQISLPANLYHKTFMEEFAARICNSIKARLIGASDKSIRDVRKEQIDTILKAVGSLQARIMDKEEAKKDQQIFRLELCKKCLESEFLERRIQGIRDLNQVISSNSTTDKQFEPKFLIQWMTDHKVFDILWVARNTHAQLVERSNEIWRFLLTEKQATDGHLGMFWTLSETSEYKAAVYKIITDTSFYLDQAQIEFIFSKINETPVKNLDMSDFDLLSQVGKYCADKKLKDGMSGFFWKIICETESFNQDLLENCITRYSEMVKFWSVDQKKPLFEKLVEKLGNPVGSVIPLIQLFKRLVSDHKDNLGYKSYGKTNQTNQTQVGQSHGTFTNAQGMVIKSYSNINTQPSAQAEPEEKEIKQEKENKELHFVDMLDGLNSELQLTQKLLSNLSNYCTKAKAKLNEQPELAQEERTKLRLTQRKESHNDEISERLNFLQFYAQNSTFQNSQTELKVIYDLLSESPIQSDTTEFLQWCKRCCESQTSTSTILDLNEVGEFFDGLIKSKALNLKQLPSIGFEFLAQYWISVNENNSKVLKMQKKQPTTTNYTAGAAWKSYYNNKGFGNDDAIEEDRSDDPLFSVLIDPDQLEKTDIIWAIVLESEIKEVYQPAIKFLIYTHMSLDEGLYEDKAVITQKLITRCFEILKEKKDDHTINRILEVLMTIIQISERKGTGDVRPHNAILPGETLNRLIIRDNTSFKSENMVIRAQLSATVWEFKKEVSLLIGLSPRYTQFELPNGKKISDKMHGKVLQQLGLKNGDIITVRKVTIQEDIPVVTMVDAQNNCLVPKAHAIFSEWFDLYMDPQIGKMTPESAVRFIYGATNERCGPDDSRITGLFKAYCKADLSCKTLEREEFLNFYYTAAKDKPERVHDNLRNHNIRTDLKKLSEIVEETAFAKEEMPRFTMATKQEQFDLLMDLLNSNSESSSVVWDLVRALSTNQEIYQQVLNFSKAQTEEGQIVWENFFDLNSKYRLIYSLEIIEELIIAGENAANRKRIEFVEYQGKANQYSSQQEKKQETESNTASQTTAQTKEQEAESEMDLQRRKWTSVFLKNGGFKHVLDLLNQKAQEPASTETFELKQIQFYATLLSVFLNSAISSSNDTAIKITSEAEKQQVIQSVEFNQLQNNLLSLVSQIIGKNAFTPEDKFIVQNCLSLLQGCILYKPELFEQFQAWTSESPIANSKDFIMTGVLMCPAEKIRTDFLDFLTMIVKQDNSTDKSRLVFLLGLTASKFDQIAKNQAREYFKLLDTLINMYAELNLGESTNIYDPEKLLSQIIDKIREIQEATRLTKMPKADDAKVEGVDELQAQVAAAENETLLVGLIELTGKILQNVQADASARIVEEKQLISEIFQEFLFASYFQALEEGDHEVKLVQKQGSNKGKKKEQVSNSGSKAAAYELLIQLIKKSPQTMQSFLQHQLQPLVKTIKKPNQWNYQPPNSSERMQAYVGIRNLGCICYMNSMMQQFFMIPAFRYNLLCVSDGLDPNPQDYKGEKYDDNMLHQMQTLIAHLELSERNDYDPRGFCFSFKEMDGQPTNTAEQKDAQEFLNVLFDRLENALKPTSRKYLLQSIFGGKQVNQMVCQECGKVKNREEDFYTQTLVVKDIKSVYDSLQKQLEGEMISDFQCDGCNKKVDISKRTLISETPNVLIVHCQRICFDFETFRNTKINTLFKFPHVLDLKPYSYYDVMGRENRLPQKKSEEEEETEVKEEDLTPEELEKKRQQEEDFKHPIVEDCFEYKLVGVNVHSGTANAGHYWSYINTNRGVDEAEGGDPTWLQTEKDPWMEFNDSSVRDYKFKDLDDDCKGDDDKKTGGGYSWGGGSYGKSGYMFFYERRKKKDLVVVLPLFDIKQQGQEGRPIKATAFTPIKDEREVNTQVQKIRDILKQLSDFEPNLVIKKNEDGIEDVVKDLKLVFKLDKTSTEPEGSLSITNLDSNETVLMPLTSISDTLNSLSQGSSSWAQIVAKYCIISDPPQLSVIYDAQSNEFKRSVQYRQGADNEAPNEIFKKVFEDNKKSSFENDIYSAEFFDFILQILGSVASLDGGAEVDQVKSLGLQIGKKSMFEILVRCFHNQKISNVAQLMIDILKTSDSLCITFLKSLLEDNNAETIMEVIIEGKDAAAIRHCARVMKFLLCKMKLIEKEDIENNVRETYDATIIDADGNVTQQQKDRPKALSLRFLNEMLSHLFDRVSRNWRQFDQYLQILFAFGVHGPDEFLQDSGLSVQPDFNKDSEAYQIGMGLYFRKKMLELIGDWVLGDSSPLKQAGETRVQMGASYQKPNFGYAMKLITVMMADKTMAEKYPFSEQAQKIIQHKDILAKMMEPETGDAYADILTSMCKDNLSLTKRMAKVYLKGINKSYNGLETSLDSLSKFLKVDDSLKQLKLEWILGVAQIKNKKQWNTQNFQYGIELVDKINDEAYTFQSNIVSNSSDEAFLQALLKLRGRVDNNCCKALRELIRLCVEDDAIFDFVYNTPAQTYQQVRYTDWFFPYLSEKRTESENVVNDKNNTTTHSYHQSRLETLKEIDQMSETFMQKVNKKKQQEAEAIKGNTAGFEGRENCWLAYQNKEVIEHYPPSYMIGQQQGESVEIMSKDFEQVTVQLLEVTNEWMYSNPTGLFNLSATDKAMRTGGGFQQMTYEQFKNIQEGAQTQAEEQPAENAEQEPTIDLQNALKRGAVLLKVQLLSRCDKMRKVYVTLKVEDNERKNVNFPHSRMSKCIFNNGNETIFVFQKIDPTKEGWGDISMEVTAKDSQSKQVTGDAVTSSGSYSTTTGGNYGAGKMTQDEPLGPRNAPAVSVKVDYDSKIPCQNCGEYCDFGQDYCHKCGEPVTLDDSAEGPAITGHDFMASYYNT